jgi:hypothetical protein
MTVVVELLAVVERRVERRGSCSTVLDLRPSGTDLEASQGKTQLVVSHH